MISVLCLFFLSEICGNSGCLFPKYCDNRIVYRQMSHKVTFSGLVVSHPQTFVLHTDNN